jgi:hypothetical protein
VESARQRLGTAFFDRRPSARSQAERLGIAVQSLARRDSIARALRARPISPGLTVIVPGRHSAADQARLVDTIRQTWRSYAGDAAKIPVVIVVVEQTESSQINARETSHAIAPSGLDGRTCAIVMTAPPLRAGKALPFDGLRDRPRELISMCVLLARHGMPGPGIANWLRSASWSAASVAPTQLALRTPEAFVDQKSDSQPRSTGGYAYESARGTSEWAVEGRVRLRLGTGEVGCLAGRDEACAATFHAASDEPAWYRDALLPIEFVRTPRASWTRPWRSTLVANVERALGPEKFEQFWASTKSPEEALAELYPGGAGALVRDRLLESRHPLSRTPWPSSSEWILIVLLISVPIGTMLLLNRNRTLKAA